MNAEKRQEIERKIVRHLIRTMEKHGWELYRVWDGEMRMKCATETEAMDVVFSVDQSCIIFVKTMRDVKFGAATVVKHFATIVLGNDGWDCIADHSCSDPERHPTDDFERIMDEEITPYYEKIEKEEC